MVSNQIAIYESELLIYKNLYKRNFDSESLRSELLGEQALETVWQKILEAISDPSLIKTVRAVKKENPIFGQKRDRFSKLFTKSTCAYGLVNMLIKIFQQCFSLAIHTDIETTFCKQHFV